MHTFDGVVYLKDILKSYMYISTMNQTRDTYEYNICVFKNG